MADDKVFRGGQRAWVVEISGAPAGLAERCVEVDGGMWALPMVDATGGGSIWRECIANKADWNEVKLKFLQDKDTKFWKDTAHNAATGKGASKEIRFNITVRYRDFEKKQLMEINYLNCTLMSHGFSGFVSTESGTAATEEVTMCPEYCEVK